MSSPQTVVIASGNRGKLLEIQAILSERNIELRAQDEFAVPEAEETGLSFVENALIKARNAAMHAGLPAIADDSGIEVDCLEGEPGIHSARYAGPQATDEENLQLLLDKVRDYEESVVTARFQCVMVYMRHAKDPVPLIAQGSWEGHIVSEPRGTNGFGYDPVFYVPDHRCTSAELPAEVKNSISHRSRALKSLVGLLSRGQQA